MKALLYLTRRSFINNLKKAVKKPASLLVIIICIVYAIFVAVMLGQLVTKVHFSSAKGLTIIITLWTLYIFLSNFASYASKKGVLFKPSHAHFVFTAPISPKKILLHSAWMNYLLTIVVSILFLIAGLTVFGIPPWKMILFFLVECVVETVFEVSVMIFLYTNDKIPAKVMKGVSTGIKVFLVAVAVVIVVYFKKQGISLETAAAFFDWPGLQMIPVVGWNIAAYRLILLGPDMLNVICTVLYLLTVAGMILAAIRMKCDGDYYEDAAKFADDYAEMRKRKVNGEMVMGIGEKKKRFRRVNDTFKGTGAKAIFYRQLLEYKKEKYFIFSKMTLLCLAIAVLLSRVMKDSAMKSGMPEMYMLGIIMYMTLILTGDLGKWENELKTPYLFLIPDSPVRKLWYATLMEHIKALVDGCIFCIPLSVAWGIGPVQTILAILTYAVLQANRLYTKVIAQCLLGDTMGKTGQDFVRAIIQMTVLGIGIAIAVAAGFMVNIDLVFPIIFIYSMIITVVIGLLASIRFYSMEQLA